MFLIRAFGLSKERLTEVGCVFSDKSLKFKDLLFRMKRKKYDMLFFIIFFMFHDFRFGLGIVTTHFIYQYLKLHY